VGAHAAAPSARDVPRIRAHMAAWAADATRYGARAWLRGPRARRWSAANASTSCAA